MITEQIKKFNSNQSYNLFKEIISEIFKDREKCRECKKEIYYKISKFRIKKTGKIEIIGPSFQTAKKHGDKLKVCEECIIKKFPEYPNLNKSRIFNTSNKITLWAFDIKNLDLYKTGPTKEKMIKKYGEIEGLKRWDFYRQKQAYSNSLEYKKINHGWSENKFKNFNKSRGITLNNLIKKYGIENGNKKCEIYLFKQKTTKSFPYMVKKYGLKKAKEINLAKALTLKNFTKRLGKNKGLKAYEKYIQKIKSPYSNISQKLFREIDEYLKKYKTYFATKNTEFAVNTTKGYKKLDYFIKDLNICIEFNGDLFHGNPIYFKKYDHPHPFNPNLTAQEIWNMDSIRYKTLLKEHHIKTIVIWESDYKKGLNIKQILIENGILF